MKYVPNILTISRLIFIPFILGCIINEEWIIAIILYTISSISDVLDGYIARKYNVISDFGKLVDPLADKLTQLSTIGSLTLKGIIPIWIIIVLVIKEILMIAGASFLYGKEIVVSSKWYGKATTVLLFIAVISSIFVRMYDLYSFDIIIYSLAVILAIFSMISYYKYFYQQGYLLGKNEVKKIVKPTQGQKREHVISSNEIKKMKKDKNYSKSVLSDKK